MKTVTLEALISAAKAGALVVDVREPAEHRSGHLEGALLLPLSRLESGLDELPRDRDLYLHCRSGGRARQAAKILESRGFARIFVADGCPVAATGGVWAMERQVRFAAGAMVLAGLALSLAHPNFLWLSAFVGAGLVFSAITDTCAMARALAILPWNR